MEFFLELTSVESLNIGYNQARNIDFKLLQNSSEIQNLIASSLKISSFDFFKHLRKIECLILEKTQIF